MLRYTDVMDSRGRKSEDRETWEQRPSSEIEARIEEMEAIARPTIWEALLHATLLKILEDRGEDFGRDGQVQRRAPPRHPPRDRG